MALLTKEIERKLAKLAALEAGGVDNWEWYDEALKEYRATIERDEMTACQDDFNKRVSMMLKPAALRQQQGVPIDVYAEMVYLRYCHSIGASGADWKAVETKDVWREQALALLNAQVV